MHFETLSFLQPQHCVTARAPRAPFIQATNLIPKDDCTNQSPTNARASASVTAQVFGRGLPVFRRDQAMADLESDLAELAPAGHESEDEASAEQESPEGKKGKDKKGKPCKESAAAKVKAKAKGKAIGKRKAAKGLSVKPPILDSDWKKCADCRKWKGISEFYNDQSKCRQCSNRRRNFSRTIDAQGYAKTVKDLETNDPKQSASMFQNFCKFKDNQEKTAEKIKWSFMGFQQDWYSKEGMRKEGVWEMMWEGEHKEFAQSAKGGFKTDSEIKSEWAQMLLEAEQGKRGGDEDGPRGYKRVAVKVKDRMSEYEDVGKGSSAYRQEKGKKDMTEEQFQNKVALAMSGAFKDLGCNDDPDGQGFMGKIMVRALASMGGSSSSMLDGSLTTPNLMGLMAGKAAQAQAQGGKSGKGR